MSNLTSSNSSTNQRMQDSEGAEQPSNTSKFMSRIKSELQVENHLKHVDQELHQKRVHNLKKELEFLKATEWKYQPVDRNMEHVYRS